MKDFIRDHKAQLVAEDEVFGTQLAWRQAIMGSSGSKYLFELVKRQLPTVDKAIEKETASQNLQKLMRSGLYKLCNADAQYLVTQATKCIDLVVAGDSPQLTENPITELAIVYSALPHFFRRGGKSGHEAWLALMAELDAAATPHDMEVYVRWSWLGSPIDHSKISTKRDAITTSVRAAKGAKGKADGKGKAGRGGRGRGKGGKAAASSGLAAVAPGAAEEILEPPSESDPEP